MIHFRLFLLLVALNIYTAFGQGQHPGKSMITLSGFEFRAQSDDVWHAATVPGTIHTDLLAHGLIPDPYAGENEKQVQWVGAQKWHYRTTFNCSELQHFSHAELVLEGLDTHADLFVDGDKILSTHNSFRSYRLPLKPEWRTGNHELLIVFHPAEALDSIAAAQYGSKLPDNRTFSRKPGYQYGWDWGPKLVTCGITAPVTIVGWNALKVISAQVTTLAIHPRYATMMAETELHADDSLSVTFTVSVAETGETAEKKTALKPGINHIAIPFKVKNPKLWWPNGSGKPSLYHLTIQGEKLSPNITIPFGIRTTELITSTDHSGSGFYFRISGKDIFAKGANYIPQDNFTPRKTDDDYRRLLISSARQGFNMVRVWGGGTYERDIFYHLCDSLGLMVWQDFMFACYFPPATPEMVEEISLEAEYQVKRLRRHPSVVLWCGNNEIDEAWHNWGYQKVYGYTAADTARVWGDYQRIFHQLLPGILQRLDPGRPWWPSSPMIGWGRQESLKSGDMHYWGVWWGNEPFEIYRQKTGRFMSEYGFQSYAHPATIGHWSGNADSLSPRHPHIAAHQKHPTGGATIETYLKREFNIPADFDHYIYLSQVLQARGMAVAIESHRMASPDCMGTLFWQLNDCWPVTSWSAIDYFGRPKAFFHHLRRLFAPTLLAAHVSHDTLIVQAVTDTADLHKLTVTTELWTMTGQKISTLTSVHHLQRNEAITLQRLPLSAFAPETGTDTTRHFSISRLTTTDGKVLSSCRTLLCKPKNLIPNVPRPRAALEMIKPGLFQLTLTAQQAAFDVFAVVECDPEAIFSDNFVDVMPGETVMIQLSSHLPIEELRQCLSLRTWLQEMPD